MFETLATAFVGGLIAILAQSAGPVIGHFLGSRAVRSERKRQKAADALEAIAEIDAYLSTLTSIRAFGREGAEPTPPLWKLKAITGVHFKNLRSLIPPFAVTIHAYESWITQAAQRRLNGDAVSLTSGFEPIYQAYIRQRDSFEDRVLDELAAIED